MVETQGAAPAVASGAAPRADARLMRKALLIRRFEERLLQLFAAGKLNGTVHTCVGQEWSAVAVAAALEADDVVFSNHRGHGHYLARYEELAGLFAELMGRATGVSGGIGGSQHLVGPRFYSNGIQGGMTPVAVGSALALQLQQRGSIAVAFLGDGTLGEGTLYESLNIASRWSVPALFVVENNQYAQSTAASQTTSGSVESRAAAFGIHFDRGSTWQYEALTLRARELVSFVRREQRPAVLEIQTYRLNAHSKGDDNRDQAEVARFRELDPINRWAAADPVGFALVDAEIMAALDAALAEAERAPLCAYTPAPPSSRQPVTWRAATAERERHVDAIYRALRERFESDPRVFMLGEDIEGPYGGAFKVTKDLSQRFPGRVRNTPISESSIVGVASGLALHGHRAIAEIMFGDFLTLTFDQLYQHAAKFQTMYNGRVTLPMIVRTPMGGRRGYGPTHSQSIEKFFLGIPGLRVLALNNRVSPYDTYRTLLDEVQRPTLVIENKVLYTRFVQDARPDGFASEVSDDTYPTLRIRPTFDDASLTIVCYGGVLEEAEAALNRLLDEHEIAAEIVCPTQLYPLNTEPILESLGRTGRLLTVEEGPMTAGFGAEVFAAAVQAGISLRRGQRLGFDGVIPASLPVELRLLPNAESITAAALELVG